MHLPTATELIEAKLGGMYDHLPMLGYSEDKPLQGRGFNALIDKGGSVEHGTRPHAEFQGLEIPNIGPDQLHSDSEDYYTGNHYDHFEDLVKDHGVRVSVGECGDFDNPKEINVQMRHDSPTARQHAAAFIRDHHSPGMSVYVDYVDGKKLGQAGVQLGGGAGADPTVSSHSFKGLDAKKKAITHLTMAKVAPIKSAIALARSYDY